jgi:predicted transcriptional regulator
VHALVKDIMTTDVAAVRSDTPYREMAALLRSRRVSGLPVVDAEGIVVGVVSETDLLERALEPGQDRWPHRKHVTAAELTARDLMSHPAVTTSPDEPVAGPDEDIYREITQDVILDGFFTDPARLTVTVKDEIVTLAGEQGLTRWARLLSHRSVADG